MSDDGIPDWIRDFYDGDVPSVLEDPGGPIHIDGMALSTNTATIDDSHLRDHAKAEARKFAEYVIDEAAVEITAESLTVETVREAVHKLEANGYWVTDRVDADGTPGIGFSHPDQFADLREQWDEMARVPSGTDSPAASMRKIGVDGVDVHEDRSMPEGRAVVMHPDAAAPRPPERALGAPRGPLDASLSPRPWLVRDPKGIVVIDTPGEGDE